VSDVGHTVVVEDEPGLELRLGLGELGLGDPVARRQVQLANERRLDVAEGRAVCGPDTIYTNGCSVGSSEPVPTMRFSGW
jgi:hypothetical protein